jgi:hypothetical protein
MHGTEPTRSPRAAPTATSCLARPSTLCRYMQRATTSVHAMVIGTTHRYRSKYVTTVMYKPRKRQKQQAAAAGSEGSMQMSASGGRAQSPRANASSSPRNFAGSTATSHMVQ